MHALRPSVLAAVALAAWPAAASADSVLAPAPGARHLAAGGGWLAWAASDGEAWRLVLRAPDGTVSRPDVPAFDRAPRASIGSAFRGNERRLFAVYERDGDIHRLDLTSFREGRIGGVSTRGHRELAPSLQLGVLTFARRGGRRDGLYVTTRRGRIRRIARAAPGITVTNGSRVAYARGRRVVLRRVSGRGRIVSFRNTSRPMSLTLTRYRVGWLLRGGSVFQTVRFGGSGRQERPRATESARQLPATTTSIALSRDRIALFLDADAVKLADPPLSFGF